MDICARKILIIIIKKLLKNKYKIMIKINI